VVIVTIRSPPYVANKIKNAAIGGLAILSSLIFFSKTRKKLFQLKE
jgi:hypothetical protein